MLSFDRFLGRIDDLSGLTPWDRETRSLRKGERMGEDQVKPRAVVRGNLPKSVSLSDSALDSIGPE